MTALNYSDRLKALSPVYPLSQQQQGLWFLYQLAPDSVAYNIHQTVRIRGEFDLIAWERAWRQIGQAHPILRSHYLEAQSVVQSDAIPLRLVQGKFDLKTEILAEVARPFRLEIEPAIRVSLFQCSSDEVIQVITMHHIAGDMWTFDLLLQEWQQLYQANPVLEKPTYDQYVQWQTEWLNCDRTQASIEFWKQQLAGELQPLDLPCKSASPSEQSETQAFVLPPHLIEPLRAQGYSLYRVLLTAFLILLYRYTDSTDFAIGTAMAGRWGQESFQNTIGYFSNMLPLRVAVQGDWTFRELLDHVSQTVTETQEHQDIPLQELMRQIQRDLFSVTFTWQKHRWINSSCAGLEFEPYLLEHQCGAAFDLDLQIVEAGDRFNIVWQYNANRFETDAIARMARQFETLLESVIGDPHMRISALAILPTEEQHQLVVEWNQTARSIPECCVHELIAVQAEKTPNAIALEFGQAQLTYRELEAQSNQLARYLQAKGVQPDSLVGVCLERSIEFVVSILGVLKAGGAFVPLDPTYPQDRLDFLIADAQVKLLLTQDNLAEIRSLSSDPVVSPVTPSHLAYVIYTSGSTGKPKGVMIEHQSLINHNLAVIQEYELTASDRVLQAAALSFDIAIEEIFPTLITGAKLVLRSADCLLSIQQFLQFVEVHQITVLNLPTALWHQIVYALTELDLTLSPAVRLVVVGGEKASRSTYLTWLERVGHYPRWLNTYGPTEITVIATIYDPLRSGFEQAELSIGSAISNTQTYVLDSQLQPVPIGAIGELCIGGFGVARGYLRRPERNQEKFIQHSSLGRLYRTGDRVRYRPDGNLEYLGRDDGQVKIRGFRVELAEIETQLNRHPAIKAAIVLAQHQHLTAYFIPQMSIELRDIQQFLQQSLPSYMVPSSFVELETFPLTVNGKVDQKALLALTPSTVTRAIAPPETALEHQLIQLWEAGLKVSPIGLDDDFFELGGHSLLLLRLVSQMEQILGRPIQVATLYQWRTVRQLVQAIDDEQTDLASALIQFQAGDPTRSPLFCIPGAMGTFRYCEGLRASLDPAQPIYGIQEIPVTPETTLEEMAGHAVEQIQRLLPEGAYYLIGYSMGSAVAYEIAQQLHDRGQEVALLALITPGNLITLPPQLTWMQNIQGLHVLLEVLTRWSAFPLESRSMNWLDRVWFFCKKLILMVKFLLREGWYAQTQKSKAALYRKYNRIIDPYQPRSSAFPVQLFMSEEEIVLTDLWVSWRVLCEQNCEKNLAVHILPGDHLSCVEKSAIAQLVSTIGHLLPQK